MIKITKFILDERDSDGDMTSSADITVTNISEERVRRIRHSEVYMDHGGGPIKFDAENSEDVLLEPGESATVSPFAWLKGCATAGGRDDVTMIATCRLMKRKFIKLGSIGIPAPGSAASRVVRVDSELIENEVMVNVSVDKPDSGGDCSTEVRVLVRNATSIFMEGAEVKVQLIDEEDSQVDDTCCEEHIPANGQGMFELSFWSMRASQLRDASVKINLYIYEEVASGTAERVSDPG